MDFVHPAPHKTHLFKSVYFVFVAFGQDRIHCPAEKKNVSPMTVSSHFCFAENSRKINCFQQYIPILTAQETVAARDRKP
jgi:hypothetical protein